MARETIIPAQTIYREIQSLQEFPESKFVRVIVGRTDAEGEFITPQQFDIYIIEKDEYTELLSPNPSWNPSKPSGTYFNEDLWHFILK